MAHEHGHAEHVLHAENHSDPVLPLLPKHQQQQQQRKSFHLLCLVLPFFFPSLGGFLYGYDVGATSVAVLSIQSSSLSGTDWYALTSVESGFVESGSLYGALLGSALSFTVEDLLGRRRQIIVASLLYSTGALIESLAPNLAIFLLGRLLYGFGIGMAMHGAPLYIAETCPSSIRGTMVSLKEVMVVMGMLFGYIIGYVQVNAVGGWRIMYFVGGPLGLIMCIGMWWLPPSPRWLLLCGLKGRTNFQQAREIAVKSICRLRGSVVQEFEVEMELEEALESLQATTEACKGGVMEIFRGKNLKALQIGIGLVFFQQFTGQPSLLYYAASVFMSAGFSAASNATLISIILSTFKAFITLFAVWKVDKIGRWPILLLGALGLTISVFMLAIYYAYISDLHALGVIAVFLYVSFYQISFGPITWLLLSEIFPLSNRGRFMSIVVLINFAGNAIVTFAFSPIQEAFGSATPFFAFGIVGVVSVAFIFLKVPETKGLSLEEIEAKL